LACFGRFDPGLVSGNGTRFVWYPAVWDFLAEDEEVVEGALVHEMEAGFVAVHKGLAEDVVGFGEGGGDAIEEVAGGLSGGVVVEHAGLDGPGTADAPEGGGHLFDSGELDAIGGLEAFDQLGHEGVEGLLGFAFEDDAIG